MMEMLEHGAGLLYTPPDADELAQHILILLNRFSIRPRRFTDRRLPPHRVNYPMAISKKDIVRQLKETANLLEVLGQDAFKARAYQNAARQLDSFEGDVVTHLMEGTLTEIRGIGKGLAEELASLKSQETLPLLETLRAQVPVEVRELFLVSGLGAKKISSLWDAGILGIAGLIAAADDGRLAKLKGFGQKSATAIREGAAFVLEAQRYLRLDSAELFFETLSQELRTAFPQIRIQETGDYRRRCEVISELALIVGGVDTSDLLRYLQNSLEPSALTVTEDDILCQIEGMTVRFWLEKPTAALLLTTTGTEVFVASVAERLAAQGRNSEDYSDEAALFSALELAVTPPERRESAIPEPVSDLIDLSDICGLVHNHTDWSDAADSISEMAQKTAELGYRYLGLADHSRSSYYANGLSIERVYAQAEAIAEVRKSLPEGFQLLHGLEVDILPDGSLDYPDEVLASLDYVVISVHQQFGLSKEKQTERIIRAVQNPYADVLGHMTGRLLLRRPPYELDIQAVIEACAATGTVIELNANPYRLDLDWRYLIRAKALGCNVAINPDAHHTDGLEDIRFGVMMARKAGLSNRDIVNAEPDAGAFLARLKRYALS
jgi:DNA polymerase (family 10)